MTLPKEKKVCFKASMEDTIGVTAVIAVMQPATESQTSIELKQPLKSCTSKKIRVLLDSGSEETLIS